MPRKAGFLDDLHRYKWWPAKEFFYDLLRGPIEEATGAPAPKSVRMQSAGADAAYDPAKAEITADWLRAYEEFPPDIAARYDPLIEADTLYFSYEMSPGLRGYLDRRGVPYLEFRISPLRFMSDLVMAARSNDRTIAQLLDQLAITRTEVRREVDRMRAALRYRQRHRALIPPLANATVFIGQGGDDGALVKDGKIARLEDVWTQLLAAMRGRRLFYLPHPHAPGAHVDEESAALVRLQPDCERIASNAYDLFASEDDVAFVSISSGAIQEAEAFGKTARMALAPVCPLHYPSENDSSGFAQIALDVFTAPEFVAAVLGKRRARPARMPLAAMPANVLRRLHDVWWAYGDLLTRDDLVHHSVIGAITTLEARLEAGERETQSSIAFVLDTLAADPDAQPRFHARHLECRWRWFDGAVIEFAADGKVRRDGVAVGRYWVVSETARTILLAWTGQKWIDRATVAADGAQLDIVNNVGSTFRAVRVDTA